MRIAIFLMVFALGIDAQALTDDRCFGRLASVEQAIQCAEIRSPEVKEATLALAQAKARVGAAGQWRNPELSTESFQGKSGSDRNSETDISMSIPIELGGKIGARTAAAKGRVAQAEAELYASQANVRKTLLLKFHRLRQLQHELEVINEAVGTFSKLVTQYGNRPKLSPEQETSSAVFRMSKSEYELKRTSASDELSELNSYFLLTLGKSFEELKSILPASPKTWPSTDSLKGSLNSPQLKVAEAEVQNSEAEYAIERAEVWPTLMVGPSIKLQREGGRSDQLYGFNVSLPLPIFNANQAGRTAALTGVRVAEGRKSILQDKILRHQEELVRIYGQSVEALSSTLSHQEIENRHRDTERLFVRGIIPSSLVIEAHRTFVDLEKSRNERELKALDTLYSLKILLGEISEIKP